MKKRNEKGQFSKTKVSEFGFVNLSTYTSPQIKEVTGADWIEYGADNNYFQYLIDRYNGSPTNNAAINGISQQIYGKGLNATDSNKKPNEYAQMVSLFRKDVVRRLCYDLKLMGQCAVQVIYSKDRSKIVQLEHMPIETLRAEKCDEDGNVPAYYYFNDWANIKRTDKPLRIPAFGMSKESIEIYYIKPYKSGFYYYSPVDYQGGLQYAQLEEEVSNYHLNNILNGLAPSMLINFNNGTPNQQERQLIETKIAQKFSGTSNAGKFILAFNDNKESQAEITPVQLSDAHNQYQFLSEESTKKIMVAHRIVSPMLLGIKDQSGLGNNADEIKTASLLMDNTVIRPFQELLIDNFDTILAYNDISLNLYFTTLQPLEFTEVDNLLQDKETIEEETGVEMSSDKIDAVLEQFGEEEDLSEWQLIDERKVNYDEEAELDYQIDQLNKKKTSTLSKIWNFVSTGTARPNAKSEQDGDVDSVEFKVRYQYAPLKDTFKKGKNVTRDFCQLMISAKKIYRKEDIIQMGDQAVNAGWGPRGAATYSIWEYKGGGACHHYWMRKTYMKKGKGQIDITSPLVPTISVNRARKEGFVPEVNDELVAKRPIDMPNKGFLE
jgi:hypothetical protein